MGRAPPLEPEMECSAPSLMAPPASPTDPVAGAICNVVTSNASKNAYNMFEEMPPIFWSATTWLVVASVLRDNSSTVTAMQQFWYMRRHGMWCCRQRRFVPSIGQHNSENS